MGMYHKIIKAELSDAGRLRATFTSGEVIELDLAKWDSGGARLSSLEDQRGFVLRDVGHWLEWPGGVEITAESLHEAGIVVVPAAGTDLPETYCPLLPEIACECFEVTAPDDLKGRPLPLYPVWIQDGPQGRGFYYQRADRLDGGLGVTCKQISPTPSGYLEAPLLSQSVDAVVVDMLQRRLRTPGGFFGKPVSEICVGEWPESLTQIGFHISRGVPRREDVQLRLERVLSESAELVSSWVRGESGAAQQCAASIGLRYSIWTDQNWFGWQEIGLRFSVAVDFTTGSSVDEGQTAVLSFGSRSSRAA
jgi:hypothetical protein